MIAAGQLPSVFDHASRWINCINPRPTLSHHASDGTRPGASVEHSPWFIPDQPIEDIENGVRIGRPVMIRRNDARILKLARELGSEMVWLGQ
jgi:hypothetical protein